MRVLPGWIGRVARVAGGVAILCLAGVAQEKKPQVRINYLNVCTPSDAETHELQAALARVPGDAHFITDFEVSRGRSTLSGPSLSMDEAGLAPLEASVNPGVSSWVRIRREFPPASPFLSVQYSMSVDTQSLVETLVFRMREPKDLQAISIEDRVSPAVDPATALEAQTPANHIRIERFGKSSVALARCPAADQKAYGPLFLKGSEILAHYRRALGARKTVPADMRRLGITVAASPAPANPKKKRVEAPPPAGAPTPKAP
jgi:hypothetical protein